MQYQTQRTDVVLDASIGHHLVDPPYASVPRRLGANLSDAVLAFAVFAATGAIAGLLGTLTTAYIVGGVAVLALGVLQWWLLGTKAFTVGSAVMRVRVVDAHTGGTIGLVHALARFAVLMLCTVLLVPLVVLLGLLVRDERRQGWHDKAARCVVVEKGREGEVGRTAESADTYVSRTPPPPPRGPSLATSPSDPEAPAAAPVESGSDRTVLLSRPARGVTDRVAPVSAPTAPSTGHTVAHPLVSRWVLRPSRGPEVALVAPVVAGRDPDARLREGAVAWCLDDPDRTVSKSHASFTVIGALLWVEDLDSMHGVVIRRNGDEAKIDPRRSTRLLHDDVVLLGAFEIKVEGTA